MGTLIVWQAPCLYKYICFLLSPWPTSLCLSCAKISRDSYNFTLDAVGHNGVPKRACFGFNHPPGMSNSQQGGIQFFSVFHDDLLFIFLQEIKTIQFWWFCLCLWLTFVVYTAIRSG
jgi:hypothetical protein